MKAIKIILAIAVGIFLTSCEQTPNSGKGVWLPGTAVKYDNMSATYYTHVDTDGDGVLDMAIVKIKAEVADSIEQLNIPLVFDVHKYQYQNSKYMGFRTPDQDTKLKKLCKEYFAASDTVQVK